MVAINIINKFDTRDTEIYSSKEVHGNYNNDNNNNYNYNESSNIQIRKNFDIINSLIMTFSILIDRKTKVRNRKTQTDPHLRHVESPSSSSLPPLLETDISPQQKGISK
ncbi:hypothetical protein Glove_134g34 [Diversispora epigaea]|uniref:Uncharacterized protein n=1 Tax=Diversispora epigaea TaxID=1348612 RepID=A0A397IX92_9GLOM|nr:hypothetical protein Glove_134g34 [Diversispora epigaea]